MMRCKFNYFSRLLIHHFFLSLAYILREIPKLTKEKKDFNNNFQKAFFFGNLMAISEILCVIGYPFLYFSSKNKKPLERHTLKKDPVITYNPTNNQKIKVRKSTKKGCIYFYFFLVGATDYCTFILMTYFILKSNSNNANNNQMKKEFVQLFKIIQTFPLIYISKKLFKTDIYPHHKCSLFFILIPSALQISVIFFLESVRIEDAWMILVFIFELCESGCFAYTKWFMQIYGYDYFISNFFKGISGLITGLIITFFWWILLKIPSFKNLFGSNSFTEFFKEYLGDPSNVINLKIGTWVLCSFLLNIFAHILLWKFHLYHMGASYGISGLVLLFISMGSSKKALYLVFSIINFSFILLGFLILLEILTCFHCGLERKTKVNMEEVMIKEEKEIEREREKEKEVKEEKENEEENKERKNIINQMEAVETGVLSDF